MAHQNTDPDKLSLAGMSGGNKPDFGGVSTGSPRQSGSGKPDFSGVTTGSSSVVGAGGTGHRSHTVQSGDSLSRIAKDVYGDASRWEAIFEANRDQIDDPDKIFPGQVLRLP